MFSFAALVHVVNLGHRIFDVFSLFLQCRKLSKTRKQARPNFFLVAYM